MSRSSQPIELLSVDSVEPSLARGMSIKLVPPETGAVPVPLRSDSSGSSLEISIPSQTKKIEELCDTHEKVAGSILPLNRTESRLPSLEDMILDDSLRDSVVTRGHKFAFLDQLLSALAHREPAERVEALHEVGRGARPEELAGLPTDAQHAYIDSLCLFIRQQLSKTVDYYRTLVDLRSTGSDISAESSKHHSRLRATSDVSEKCIYVPLTDRPAPGTSIHEFMIDGPTEYTVDKWGQISSGLNVLLKLVAEDHIKDLVWTQEIAQTMITHVDFIAVAYLASQGRTGICAKACTESLLANVCKFLSNLAVNRDDLREQLLRAMWPNAYWCLALSAGARFREEFCLMLNTHISHLLSVDCHIKPEDQAEDKQRDDLGKLKADFINMSLTDRQASRAGWPDKFSSSFAGIYGYLLAVTDVDGHAEHSLDRNNKRHATIQGRVYQVEAVSGSYFSLFQLRLLSLGQGRAVHLLCKHLLSEQVLDEVPPAVRAMSWLAKLPERRHVSQPQLVGNLLHALSELASTPGDYQDQVRPVQTRPSNERANRILGRGWPLIQRSFVRPEVLKLIVDLLRQGLAAAPIEDVGPQVKALVSDTSSSTDLETALMVRPAIRAIGAILAAPETELESAIDEYEFLWRVGWALLSCAAPDLREYLAVSRRTGDQPATAFVRKINLYSCRDTMIVLAALVRLRPELAHSIPSFEPVTQLQAIQDVDVGADAACALLLAVLGQAGATPQRHI